MSVEDMLGAIKKQLENHEKRISRLEAQPQEKEETIKKKLSVKEFILSKKPKNRVQKTLVIGYYLEKYESCSPFNVKELEAGFRSAKEPVPDNINRAVIGNIAQGYLMEAKEKKDGKMAWELTNLGEQYIEGGLAKK